MVSLDYVLLIVYIFIIISGVVCLFLACMFRRGEPRKWFQLKRRRFWQRFFRSKPDNRYKWADSADEAARRRTLPPSTEPNLELINLYLKKPIKLTDEEKRRSNVSEAELQAEKELIMKHRAMYETPPPIKFYTRRDGKYKPKPHVEIQVEAEVEPLRTRHTHAKPRTEPKVRFQKKFTSRPQHRREDIKADDDAIEVVDEQPYSWRHSHSNKKKENFLSREQLHREDVETRRNTIKVMSPPDIGYHIV